MELLRFEEWYAERIWGGTKLGTVLGKAVPAGKTIGEAWLVSDHPQHESVVAEGRFRGAALRTLLETDAPAILGSHAHLTVHGRFPLLLKLIDAGEVLSVQVHPDDDAARRLNEPDVGKTEMWHVLHADPGSQLICGLNPAATRERFEESIQAGTVEDLMTRFPASADDSVFVPAGTVHAIGQGILLAEIQQNSDLTYRVYDWERVDPEGQPRSLHVDKAVEVTHFGAGHGGPNHPMAYALPGAECQVLAACRYFAAEQVQVSGAFTRRLSGHSFHLLLAKDGPLTFCGETEEYVLRPGEGVLAPGSLPAYHVTGKGRFLDYYVPDLQNDVIAPLLKAGHSHEEIGRLGGVSDSNYLRSVL